MALGSRSGWLWVGVSVVLLSCGGTVIPSNDDAGTGAGGDTSGGTGGAVTGGSGGVAGTGGQVVGGAGGGVAGTGGQIVGGAGGGVAGTGGQIVGGAGGGVAGGGGSPGCPPAPSCNWCGGSPRYDGNGCVVGYICANGADACMTPPCYTDADCAGGSCKENLCWGGGIVCSPQDCVGSGGGGSSTCSCKWSCSDGNAYSFDCTAQGGGLSCTCYENGYSNIGCGTAGGAGGGGGAPNACLSCCGFPQ